MVELRRAFFFKFHSELTKNKGGRGRSGVHPRKLGHKIQKFCASDSFLYVRDLTTWMWRTATSTQCDTCRASICNDMTSSQTNCGYHRVLENLTHHQPVQKFPSFCETRRLVIVFTTSEHFSLSWVRRTQLRLPQPISLTLRRLMSYIYGAPILDVSRSHTTTQHSR